jgi:hypothetical protein
MAYDGSRPTTPNPSVLPPFLCHSNEGMPQDERGFTGKYRAIEIVSAFLRR